MSSDDLVAADTVVVVTDDNGVIVATAHGETHAAPDAPVLEIRPRPGQRVHTIVLPPELRRLSLRERVDRLHDSYRVSPAGQLSPIAKDSAS